MLRCERVQGVGHHPALKGRLGLIGDELLRQHARDDFDTGTRMAPLVDDDPPSHGEQLRPSRAVGLVEDLGVSPRP